MTWKLFLDDERTPTHDLYDAVVARDCAEAQKLVEQFGVPELMSLDHDLGSENGEAKPSAMAFLWWLIEQDLDGKLTLGSVSRVIIHSRNTTGADNLAGLWNGYAQDIGSPVRAELRPRKTLTQ